MNDLPTYHVNPEGTVPEFLIDLAVKAPGTKVTDGVGGPVIGVIKSACVVHDSVVADAELSDGTKVQMRIY